MITEWGDVPLIQGTEAGLHDIFTNLIFNAVDAMPKGGAITLRTETVGSQVQIVFSDTGIGMDEETKLRIFEPFFTTKKDVGSGLGLSTAYNTVIGWGGSIEVDSTPGSGTTFALRFPVWGGSEAAAESESVLPLSSRGKILVVDDDEAISGLLSRLLGSRHEVEVAADGRQALDRFTAGKYDVTMIDLGMSGMSGDQLVQQLKELDPAVATVLITGWALSEMDTRMFPFDLRLAKPFDDLDEVENVVVQAIELHDERARKMS
jgi:CheY-like chemotaxis protein